MSIAIPFEGFDNLPAAIKDTVKQDLVDAVLSMITSKEIGKAGKKERQLAIRLLTNEVSLEAKWSALQEYMRSGQASFYKDIVQLGDSFLQKKNIERYLPRLRFEQYFEALSLIDAEKVKTTVIEAMLSDFSKESFLSSANRDTLDLIEELKDIKKTTEDKWRAIWAYITNTSNRNEKLYEQALGIFSVLAPSLKEGAFVRDTNILDLSKVDEPFKKLYKANLIEGLISANGIYFYSDYVSEKLIQILSNRKVDLDAKWSALEEYMSLPTNKNRELYQEAQKRFNWLISLKTSKNYRARFFSDALFEHDAGAVLFTFTLPLGAIRALTRHPLGQLEYEKALLQLADFIRNAGEETKQDFISNVARAYQERKSLLFSSKESVQLLSKLQEEGTSASKCEAIIRYMLMRNEAGYYVNNGKKMCAIIQEKLTPYLNEFELKPLVRL